MGCQSSLFGTSAQYIKVSGGDFIAIEGANTVDRLTVSDLRMPYKQLLRSRVILKTGQTNYLLNHLGLGDNATFLCIKAIYDQKSVIEEDNYVKWSFYDDMAKVHTMAQMMVLTGNSTNRIKQLYLSNPSEKYPVSLDVMVGVIDDTYTFFNDSVNQSSTSFVGLNWTDIQTHIVGESFKINDKGTPVRPLIYIEIVNIETIEKTGSILIIDDASYGTIFLQFLTEYDAYQAHSLLNFIIENPNIDISEYQSGDNEDPIIYFYSSVGDLDNDFIALDGDLINGPYNTSMGLTFSTEFSLLTYGTTASGGTSSIIDKSQLIYLLVDKITDNREGTMSMQPSNIVISNATASISTILIPGTYSLTFNFSDIAHNTLEGIHMDLTITA
jgi:hypothetical protein